MFRQLIFRTAVIGSLVSGGGVLVAKTAGALTQPKANIYTYHGRESGSSDEHNRTLLITPNGRLSISSGIFPTVNDRAAFTLSNFSISFDYDPDQNKAIFQAWDGTQWIETTQSVEGPMWTQQPEIYIVDNQNAILVSTPANTAAEFYSIDIVDGKIALHFIGSAPLRRAAGSGASKIVMTENGFQYYDFAAAEIVGTETVQPYRLQVVNVDGTTQSLEPQTLVTLADNLTPARLAIGENSMYIIADVHTEDRLITHSVLISFPDKNDVSNYTVSPFQYHGFAFTEPTVFDHSRYAIPHSVDSVDVLGDGKLIIFALEGGKPEKYGYFLWDPTVQKMSDFTMLGNYPYHFMQTRIHEEQ